MNIVGNKDETHPHLADLDQVDRKIIVLLQEDARRTNASIARHVAMSESAVKNRIDRLIESGVIRVLAAVNPVAVGLMADVLVGISVKPGTAFAVGDALCRMNQVIYLGYVTGRFDIFAEVLVPDPDELLAFLSKKLADIDGIVSMETFFVMRNQKIDYEWRLAQRLPGILDAPSSVT